MQELRKRIEVRARRVFAVVYGATAMLTPLAVSLALSPVGVAVALADEPGEAGASQAGGFASGGLTSNGWPVYFQLSRDLDQIRRAVGAIEQKCSNGGSFVGADRWARLPLSLRGRFRASDHDSYQEGSERAEADYSLRGKVNFRTGRMTGTWRNRTTIHVADGSVVTCDSGTLRFSAGF
jgi:trimethylamine:corrinoid methyltransferase-like protein